jgi:glycosyltransferase involved in cell wall biosynthesis
MSGDVIVQEKPMFASYAVAIATLEGGPLSDDGRYVSALAGKLAERGHEVLVFYRMSRFPYQPDWPNTTLIGVDDSTPIPYLVMNAVMGVLARSHLLMVLDDTNYLTVLLARLLGRKTLFVSRCGARYGTKRLLKLSKRYDQLVVDGEVTGSDEIAIIGDGADLVRPMYPYEIRQYGIERNQYYLTACPAGGQRDLDTVCENYIQSRTRKPLVILGYEGDRLSYEFSYSTQIKLVAATGENERELFCNAYAWIDPGLPGMNLPLLRALGAGMCVLARSTERSREILAEGYFGLPWRPDTLVDRIRQVENDIGLVERMRGLARRRVAERYTWDLVVDKFESAFERTLGVDGG